MVNFKKIANMGGGNNVIGVVKFSKKYNLPPPLLLGTVEYHLVHAHMRKGREAHVQQKIWAKMYHGN